MKITGSGPLRTAPIRRQERAGKSTAAGFSGELRDAGGVNSASGSGSVNALSALLAVQEIGDSGEENRRAVQRGEDILERLDELRYGLLIGAFPKEKLDQLLKTVRRQHDRFRDARLREVLQEIELRAMVELAKLGHVEK
jgi:hypothetical protein